MMRGCKVVTPFFYRGKYNYVREHVDIAERVLGKPLPDGACVHHINEDQHDNRNENLIICQDNAYHKLIHKRMEALKKCGNPNWKKCDYCGEHDDPSNMYVYHGSGTKARHTECANKWRKGWTEKNREKLNAQACERRKKREQRRRKAEA